MAKQFIQHYGNRRETAAIRERERRRDRETERQTKLDSKYKQEQVEFMARTGQRRG